MNPHFASAVDPIFLKVLALMDRVERNEVSTPEWERQSLESVIRESEAHQSDASGWNLAKYALTAWIDDLLISAPWSGRDWWESNSLEFALFRSRDRATKFFLQAKEASELPRRDALEVFYLCVILGFRGLYKLPEAPIIAGQLNLPMEIGAWTKNTAAAIQLRQGRSPIRETPQPPDGAPPLESRYSAVGAAVVTVILAVVLATVLFLKRSIKPPESDAVARARQQAGELWTR
jgi:type VI secretion system protein ImpK